MTVYANDTFGITGATTVIFTIAKPFPTNEVAAVAAIAAAVAVACLLVYFKKRRRLLKR